MRVGNWLAVFNKTCLNMKVCAQRRRRLALGKSATRRFFLLARSATLETCCASNATAPSTLAFGWTGRVVLWSEEKTCNTNTAQATTQKRSASVLKRKNTNGIILDQFFCCNSGDAKQKIFFLIQTRSRKKFDINKILVLWFNALTSSHMTGNIGTWRQKNHDT